MNLEILRIEIDLIDDEIAALLNRRMALSASVAKAKMESGGPVHCPAREAEILGRLQLTPALRNVYDAIFEASRALQRGMIE